MACNTGLRWSVGSCAAVLFLLFFCQNGSGLAMTDREDPDAMPTACTLPGDLGSFKGQPVPHTAITHMRLLYGAFGLAL